MQVYQSDTKIHEDIHVDDTEQENIIVTNVGNTKT